jgi:3-oxoacyl-[acyl-carrier-protein] synthase-1
MGVANLEARTHIYAHGHAAGARACQDALAHVTGGATERAIVCGVDSLVEAETLEFFLAKRRLKTEEWVDGLVPGEASAALLLERAPHAEKRGAQPLASIEATAAAMEPVTIWSDEPSAAVGLSEAIRATLDQLPDGGRSIRVVVCDLNGETYRAREFGNAAARTLSAIQAPLAIWHPADCIGDTGAAAFVVSACIGARALAKGYAKGDTVLTLGSSDDGLRGAAALRHVSTEGKR